ncbi:TPA: hypothetical protein RZJ41_000493, partial [Campylobacter coli]|nr:hypothetical protein [Campylobacter coli]
NTLNTLYSNLPKATDIGKTVPNNTDSNGFNNFESNTMFEESLPQKQNLDTNLQEQPSSNSNTQYENNTSKNQDGIIIFE